jgi:DNA-binding transcriptional ArsR family regulator
MTDIQERRLGRPATTQGSIIAFLAAREEPSTLDEIVAALPGKPKTAVGAALTELVKAGKVIRVHRGRYIIPALDADEAAAIRGDLYLLRILSRAALLAKEHEDMAALDELRRDLTIGMHQPDRSTIWYRGVQALIDDITE